MNKFVVLAGIWTCVLIGGFTAIMLTEDRTGPIITVNSSEIIYNQDEDKDTLLSHITAVDQIDGDVTDSVMVTDILPLLDLTSAKVVYVAEDKSNNVTKKEVYVKYVPVVEEEPQEIDQSEEDSVVDLQVSNKEEIDLNPLPKDDLAENTTPDPAPILVLDALEHTISRGDEFEPKDLVATIEDDKDLVNYLMDHLMVVGNYDVDTRGDYVLMYYAIDSDGNESERLYMILTVD